MAVVTWNYGAQARTTARETNNKPQSKKTAGAAEKDFYSSAAIIPECVVCCV
jgi:hypothetical protein